MKSIFISAVIISAVIVTIFSIFSCKKDGSNYQSSVGLLNEANQTIIRKWNLVSDSTYTGFAQYQQPYDYTGKPGDYFHFRADGKVYTKERATLDTLSYSIMPNNSWSYLRLAAN